MKRLAAIFLVLALAAPAFAIGPDEALPDPAQEERARALQKELRCLVCQGQSIDESNAPLAADLRQIVRERIAAGESDDEIKDFLVARYGDFVLMRPPVQGNTYALWFAPGLILVIGGIAVWVVVARARRRAREEGETP